MKGTTSRKIVGNARHLGRLPRHLGAHLQGPWGAPLRTLGRTSPDLGARLPGTSGRTSTAPAALHPGSLGRAPPDLGAHISGHWGAPPRDLGAHLQGPWG